MSWWRFKPYVSVAQRQANAKRELAKLTKKGRTASPVVVEGRQITSTFWGNAWCDNLEAYSDFESRMPRGRTYVRNGSVVDLQMNAGKITAMVSGSELYKVAVEIERLPATAWKSLRKRCSGRIASLLELIEGRLSDDVMTVVTDLDHGLFPKPREIKMRCSCPDWASMCKHIAAVLYGVGVRLDQKPELLFQLRQVDHRELVPDADDVARLTQSGKGRGKSIAAEELSDVFGIDLDDSRPSTPANVIAAVTKPSRRRSQSKETANSKPAKNPAAEASSESTEQKDPKLTGRKPAAPKRPTRDPSRSRRLQAARNAKKTRGAT